MIKMSRTRGSVGSRNREEHLREAAKLQILLGNVQRYCELMVELGEVRRNMAQILGCPYFEVLKQRQFVVEHRNIWRVL